jgi:hypothetical protein
MILWGCDIPTLSMSAVRNPYRGCYGLLTLTGRHVTPVLVSGFLEQNCQSDSWYLPEVPPPCRFVGDSPTDRWFGESTLVAVAECSHPIHGGNRLPSHFHKESDQLLTAQFGVGTEQVGVTPWGDIVKDHPRHIRFLPLP